LTGTATAVGDPVNAIEVVEAVEVVVVVGTVTGTMGVVVASSSSLV
jgi:hypothetical protein